tara:strand:+ start:682 stop:1482 length:801 start_codon:yes stop_codon:yes gene_type:complete
LTKKLWHENALKKIKNIFEHTKEVKAVILCGSLANENIKIDQWSDIDLKVIVNQSALNMFYPETSWSKELGTIFSIDQNQTKYSYTTRLCMEDLSRYDITFITYEDLTKIKTLNLSKKYTFIKNNIPNLEILLKNIPVEKYNGIDMNWLEEFQQAFWHKAVIAITKLKRNDLLICYHLILDLAKDCLLLKMIQRDIKYDTNIHRTGGYGNKFVKDLFKDININSKTDILNNLKLFCEKFDSLSKNLNSRSSKIKTINKFIEIAQSK